MPNMKDWNWKSIDGSLPPGLWYACVWLWAWWEVVAAHHRVHDYACCHLQADCLESGISSGPLRSITSMGKLYLFNGQVPVTLVWLHASPLFESYCLPLLTFAADAVSTTHAWFELLYYVVEKKYKKVYEHFGLTKILATGPIQNDISGKQNYNRKTVDDLILAIALVPIEIWLEEKLT